MCRTTAAPLMAMAGMAGTAVGVAIAVIREKADRRSLEREIKQEAEEEERNAKTLHDAPQGESQAENEERSP